MVLNAFSFFLRKRHKRRRLSLPIEESKLGENYLGIPFSTKVTESSRETKKSRSFFQVDADLEMKKIDSNKENHQEKLPGKRESYSLLASSLNIGYYLITPLILCLILGVLLDNIYKTRPIFTSLFIFLGTVGSFYNLFKIAKEK